MGIERILASKEIVELPKETNNRSPSRKNRRRPKKMSPVQRLYDTCKQVFAGGGPGIIPPTNEIQRLKTILDGMTGMDLGLSPTMPYFSRIAADRVPKITYLHFYACSKFSIGIFCLPPSSVIPLHNHPQMTVFSKLLFGTMHIKSCDWVEGVPSIVQPAGALRLAKVKVDGEFTAPCNTSVLYPADGGNLHCFTAVTACAVLDVLGPPYSDPEGRHCSYYLEYPFSDFSVDGLSLPKEEREGHVWLQEREVNPEELFAV